MEFDQREGNELQPGGVNIVVRIVLGRLSQPPSSSVHQIKSTDTNPFVANNQNIYHFRGRCIWFDF